MEPRLAPMAPPRVPALREPVFGWLESTCRASLKLRFYASASNIFVPQEWDNPIVPIRRCIQVFEEWTFAEDGHLKPPGSVNHPDRARGNPGGRQSQTTLPATWRGDEPVARQFGRGCQRHWANHIE